jgi:magnesium chelatase family protein
MLIKSFGCAIFGIDATVITIEVNISQGIRFMMVGLADHAVRESQQRIELAITNNGFTWPRFRVVINLAPAFFRKEGTHYDLPLAVGILAATNQVDAERVREYLILGELSLDGSIQPVKGVLPMALKAKKEGFKGVIIPRENQLEASVVEGISVIPLAHIKEVVAFLNGNDISVKTMDTGPGTARVKQEARSLDFADVRGQEMVKRAMLIAAAGWHNLLLIGPPGAGKTMLARRMPTIMPPMSLQESLQTTVIHSVAGRIGTDEGLVLQRPFRTPHHSSSSIALIGGGRIPCPGEISLAHNGILFLDELPEFKGHVLEVLRQPLEDREIHVSRASYRVVYPADFLLVAAMNPCPCGYYTHPDKRCHCGPGMIKRYLSKISGPLLDRIDMQVEVAPVPFEELSGEKDSESSVSLRARVEKAREIQEKRFSVFTGIGTNSRMNPALRNRYCILDSEGTKIIKKATGKLGLSVRAYDRILKVARTIADLEGHDCILSSHVSEAVNYRNLDREGWSG